jgi:XTP/dITP diphosphohydrolase
MLTRGDTLVFATHNPSKVREVAELAAPLGIRVVSASDLGLPEPEETGGSFEDNATLKAVAAAQASGRAAVAEDSGLVVDALGGEPGIYSARWAGPSKDFATAMRRVEDGLQAAGATIGEKRTARFVAVMCLAEPAGATELFRGEVEGRIVWPPRGDNGFGYDPIFVPDGYQRTFGEMSGVEKHRLSHRARAFAQFARAKLVGGAAA